MLTCTGSLAYIGGHIVKHYSVGEKRIPQFAQFEQPYSGQQLKSCRQEE